VGRTKERSGRPLPRSELRQKRGTSTEREFLFLGPGGPTWERGGTFFSNLREARISGASTWGAVKGLYYQGKKARKCQEKAMIVKELPRDPHRKRKIDNCQGESQHIAGGGKVTYP